MLVLSRKLGEKIYIGRDIVLVVQDIDCNKVRIGIEAPRDVPIWRKELLGKPRNSDSAPLGQKK